MPRALRRVARIRTAAKDLVEAGAGAAEIQPGVYQVGQFKLGVGYYLGTLTSGIVKTGPGGLMIGNFPASYR